MRYIYGFILLIVFGGCLNTEAQDLKIAEFDRCELENGEFIEDCKIGYRTMGELNADRDNVIVFPTWFSGKTKNLVDVVNGDFPDLSEFYVIFFDAIGNGVSSSPSNSENQYGEAFPDFAVKDMVNSQYRVLTELLDIDHVYAVIGISMGGMQTYEWGFSYPDFMDKLIPIVGSPKLSPYDIALWQTQYNLIEMQRECDCEAPMEIFSGLDILVQTSPENIFQNMDPDITLKNLSDGEAKIMEDPGSYDYQRQLKAMIAHDVYKHVNGNPEKLNELLQADLLSIVSGTDHIVTPEPAIQFANETGTEVIILETNCGHQGFSCVADDIIPVMDKFLKQGE